MKVDLAEFISGTRDGDVAESILRKCVHCGFCTATCPTYLLLGNELDGPRGRIYLIKQVLEGFQPTQRTQLHLDRCLTCRSCETTCPSGVQYSRLLEIGRDVVNQRVTRKLSQRLKQVVLCAVLPNQFLSRLTIQLVRLFAFAVPRQLRSKLPAQQKSGPWHSEQHKRKVILHRGCVQNVLTPQVNAAASRYLDALEITALQTKDGCCGALDLHSGRKEKAKQRAKHNIDTWWELLEDDVECVVSTASGCGIMLKEYAELLHGEGDYERKAKKIASLSMDLSEIYTDLEPEPAQSQNGIRVAFHSPCTLQHAQKVTSRVENILQQYGVETTLVQDAHLCCGSAGAYSIMQPDLSERLLDDKLEKLKRERPDAIATANIGCQLHLQSKSNIPVKHWVEFVAPQ